MTAAKPALTTSKNPSSSPLRNSPGRRNFHHRLMKRPPAASLPGTSTPEEEIAAFRRELGY